MSRLFSIVFVVLLTVSMVSSSDIQHTESAAEQHTVEQLQHQFQTQHIRHVDENGNVVYIHDTSDHRPDFCAIPGMEELCKQNPRPVRHDESEEHDHSHMTDMNGDENELQPSELFQPPSPQHADTQDDHHDIIVIDVHHQRNIREPGQGDDVNVGQSQQHQRNIQDPNIPIEPVQAVGPISHGHGHAAPLSISDQVDGSGSVSVPTKTIIDASSNEPITFLDVPHVRNIQTDPNTVQISTVPPSTQQDETATVPPLSHGNARPLNVVDNTDADVADVVAPNNVPLLRRLKATIPPPSQPNP